MNPHYHPYAELSSSHSPPPDNNNYHGHHPGGPNNAMSNGHVMGPPNHHHHHHHPSQPGGPLPQVPHHEQHQHPAFGGGGGGPQPGNMHHPHHHHLSNNNNNCPAVKVCAGCGGKIIERYLLHALDRYWHNNCLKCTYCGAQLAEIGGSCFTKANMILCKTDYIKLFGNSGACSACGQTIPANELVMRVGSGGPQTALQPGGNHHVFHLKCFVCTKCGSQLVPGDRYCLLAGSIVCEQDWHKLLKGSNVGAGAGTTTGTVRKGKVGRPRRSRD